MLPPVIRGKAWEGAKLSRRRRQVGTVTRVRIGFIGLGTMGAPMARNLLKAGFEVAVHNRTRSKEEPLAAAGAERAATPAEAANDADIVITIVADTPDVEAVLFGPSGVAEGAEH